MLKKVFGVVLAGVIVTASGVIVSASTAFDNTDIEGIEAYEEIIMGLDDIEDRVKIIDMDNDGIPELAVKDAGNDQNGVYIYTLEDNKAVKIYDYSDYDAYSSNINADIGITKGNDGTVYAVIITGVGGSDPWDEHDFLHKDGNSMESKIKTRYDSADLNARYMVDNTVVNKSVYDATMKQYMDFKDRTGTGNMFEYVPRIEMDKAENIADAINEAKRAKDSSIIRIYINGDELETDNDPVIINGTTMVPMRDIFEALDSNVNWDGATKSVTATKGSRAIMLTINSTEAIVNGRTNILNEAPFVNENQTTMVPLRFISEALGADVEWNGTERVITITI